MNMFPNWAKNLLFLLVYMLSGLVLVIVIEGLLSGAELLPFNTTIERTMAYIRTPLLTTVLVMVTNIGSPFLLSSAAFVIALVLALRGDTYNALLFVVAVAMAVITLTVLKDTFQVTRPSSGLVNVEGWSFPSGHATVATAFFFALAHSFFGKLRTFLGRVNLVVCSILGVLLISLSRLYLGAHWALDILAGITLGILSVSFVVLVFGVFSLENRPWLKKKTAL